MKSTHTPLLRGLIMQLFAFIVLPLTLLLLIIAFTSVFRHQEDMRSLVGERDERAVQAAAAALGAELHHRESNLSNLVALAELSKQPDIVTATDDLATDFDGGLAYLTTDGHVLASTGNFQLWDTALQSGTSLASNPSPIFSEPILDPQSKRLFVVVSAYSASRNIIVAGAFSPEILAKQVLSTSYPASELATIYVLDSSRRLLFASAADSGQTLAANHPGVSEALRGESGTRYVRVGESEHVIAYSPVSPTGWVLITEESWRAVASPSLEMTQMAPLVLVPAFLLALIALWFGAKQIVQPLQRLESKAAALAWGDFNAIGESVGGISEVRHLQMELAEMARKVQAAQEGLHDYIGAITAAQEEERMRLARELHDDTIQALKELENLAEETVENLRRLTRALRPIYLEDLGLVTALGMLANETNQTHQLQVDFQVIGNERRLSGEVELALYRIAQEALNNVVHHAKADRARLQISFDKEITLEVTDNGTGFTVPKSPTEFAPKGHFGLLGMRERADLIGARLDVQSEAGKGTKLSVRLDGSSSQPKRKKKHD
ncbi:MAG TPA: ATP-binding protein [Anaerolineales bacterium]|nr:ATP-binding protein [Anaerolineales bacterium]